MILFLGIYWEDTIKVSAKDLYKKPKVIFKILLFSVVLCSQQNIEEGTKIFCISHALIASPH